MAGPTTGDCRFLFADEAALAMLCDALELVDHDDLVRLFEAARDATVGAMQLGDALLPAYLEQRNISRRVAAD